LKDTAWRLQVTSIRAVGGHDIVLNGPCPCGWSPHPPPALSPGSQHTEAPGLARAQLLLSRACAMQEHAFGSCPVALSVLQLLRANLPASLAPLLRAQHLWTFAVPDATSCLLHEGAWGVICALALHAMGKGRASLHYLTRQSTCPPSEVVSRSANRAVGWFLHLLADFAAPGTVPKSWKPASFPPLTPFLRVLVNSAGGAVLQFQPPVIPSPLPAPLAPSMPLADG
jgi:hypothetical protein